MKHIKIIISVISLLFLFGNIQAQYSNLTEVLSSGGGQSDGGNYSNFGVIGETFVDFPVTGGNYITSIGFLYYASGIPILIDELNFNNQSIIIFPNPTTNELFIEMQNSKDVNIRIFNSIGQNVYKSKAEIISETINVAGLRKGIYFVEIKDLKGNILLSEKILKE